MAATLDPVLLRAFLAVSDEGGFTAAAGRLNTTQSTVSMRIRRLEDLAGTPLFRRDGASVTLTAAGERLQGHARDLLRRHEAAWRALCAPGVSGRVRLGIPDDYAFYLPSVLRDFTERHPGVDLRVESALSIDLAEKVRAGTLDLAIVTRQKRSPGGEVLRREPLVWVGGGAHAPAEESPLPLALYPREVCVFREQATEALDSAGRPWRVAYTSTSLTGQRAMVEAGLALSVLTPGMVPEGLRILGDAAGLPALPSVEIALHRAPGRPPEPARRLADRLREHMTAG